MCQVVRSVSDWSGGQDRTEYSIMQALVAAIAGAEHYVYIENQFFISHVKTGVPSSDVRNDVATALFSRILAAHERGDTFRVFILLPLLPAFEGDIAGDSGSGMRAIMYYQVLWPHITSAVKRSIGSTTGCTITEKAPTRAFSWLKAATTAFTFKTLC